MVLRGQHAICRDGFDKQQQGVSGEFAGMLEFQDVWEMVRWIRLDDEHRNVEIRS